MTRTEQAPPPRSPGQGRDCPPWVTVGREPGPASGPWHTLTRCACERLAADSEPPAKFSRQILPGTCQLPPLLSASNTSSVLLIAGEIGEMLQPCLSPVFALLLTAAIARCRQPSFGAAINAIFQRNASDRHRLIPAQQWHSVQPDKFPTVTSVNAVIQAADLSWQAHGGSFPFGRPGAARPTAATSTVSSAGFAVLSLQPCSSVFSAATELRSRTVLAANGGDATSSRQKPPAPSPPLSSQASQTPSKRSEVDRPFCFQRAWHVLWFTELINLPWAASFNDCSINNKFPGSCLKVYRVCALSGEPRAF